jgi:N,N'-diacetylbacillosaminyl-diphospho-undecaprenol alpha-1,3-N-acetylgalactosaminyltransferase
LKVALIVNTDGALYRFRKPIIEALVRAKHEVVTLSGESTYFADIAALGARPRAVDFGRYSIGLASNLRLFWRIAKMLKEERPHVVHSFTHKAAIFGTLAAWLVGTRGRFITITGLGTVFSNHDLRSRLIRQALLLQYRLAARLATRVFFQNPDDLALFVGKGIVPAQSAILTNGSAIDLAEFRLPDAAEVQARRQQLADRLGLASLEGRKVVLFTARGVREKGFFEFYEAARQIHELEPGRYVFVHFGLIDVGSGEFISEAETTAFANRCGVHFEGFVENIRDFLSAADVVVLPSVYREGTPRSLIEALALGKSIVTTDMPGCRETVVDGWNGYYCEGRSVASLVANLLRIDTEFIERAVVRSRRLCETKYDAHVLVRTTLAEYVEASGAG